MSNFFFFFLNFNFISLKLTDLNIGLSENKVLSNFHVDAVSLFNVCCDLGKVAADLSDPSVRLNTKVFFL
jgi:DNA ligase 4